jgi:hypothetical protein
MVFAYFNGIPAVGITDVLFAASVVGSDTQHSSGHHFCPHNLLTEILGYLVKVTPVFILYEMLIYG